MPGHRSTIVSVSLLALAVAGCNKATPDGSAITASSGVPTADGGLPPLPAALPMQTGPASQLVTAPPVTALPVRRYIGVSRPARERDRYAYLDRASDVQDEIGDAPPDYDYDNNDGVSPWVWETRGGDYRYAEPADDGYRDYYYQRGEDYPYLVRTRDRSYAYAGGALVAIYLLSGALVPQDQYGSYRDEASRYFWRGQELRRAADQRQHQGVIAANWAAQRPQFGAEQARWYQARAQQPEWQAYHAQNDPSQQPGWQQEYQQRHQVAQQFATWQSRGFASAPPPVLAVAGPRAAQPPAPGQPARFAANAPVPVASRPGLASPQGFAGPQPWQHRNMPAPPGAAPMANNAGLAAAAAHEQQLAAQRAAQQQALASQRLAQEASRAQQEAAAQRQAAAARQQQLEAHQQQLAARSAAEQQALASQKAAVEANRARQQAAAQQQEAAARQHQLALREAAQQQEAAARQRQSEARNEAQQQALAREKAAQSRQAAAAQQQMIANVHRQQEMAAQEQATARQREAQAAARQAQAQRQAEVARAQAPHPDPARPAPRPENDRQKQ